MNQYLLEQLDRMQGMIFDLDGTLLDSMDMWHQIDVEFLERRGIPLPHDYQAAVTPLGARDAAFYTIDRFGLDERPEDLMAEWAEMAYCHYRDDIPLKPFAFEYMSFLADRGIPMTIATSSNHDMVQAACERTGIAPFLSEIVTVAEIGLGKEWPDIYLRCAQIMEASPDACAVFEDIIEGVRTAKQAGFFTVGILEPGYSLQGLIRSEADAFIASFEEILPYHKTVF